MKAFGKLFKEFIRDEEGQSTTEYILILAVAVMIAVKFRGTIEKRIGSATDKLGENIDRALDPIQ